MRLWFVTFRHQLAWSFLSRRAWLPVIGLVLLLVMQILILSRRQNPDIVNQIFAGFQLWAGLTLLIPLASMYIGVSALLDDIEGGSMAYFLSRPAPRSAIFLGRCAGAGLAALLFASALVTSSFFLVRAGGTIWPILFALDTGQLGAFLAGATVASLCFVALGALLGACTRRGLLWGFALVLGGELLAGSLVARTQGAGLRSILATDLSRQLAMNLLPEAVRDTLGRSVPPLGGSGSATLLLDLARYLAVCLAGGLVCFVFKEQPYRSRES